MVFEVWAAKALECLELRGPLCGTLEDRSAERRADNGDLTCGGQQRLRGGDCLSLQTQCSAREMEPHGAQRITGPQTPTAEIFYAAEVCFCFDFIVTVLWSILFFLK